MLTPDNAQAILAQWKVDEKAKEYSSQSTSTRFLPEYLKLPKKLRNIACGLYDLDNDGRVAGDRDANEAVGELVRLPSKDRLKILSIPLPKLAVAIEKTLVWQRSAPYQFGYYRKGFRHQFNSDDVLHHQLQMIKGFLAFAEEFKNEILTPTWCAIWAPYIRVGWNRLEEVASPMLSALIQAGGKEGDEIFNLLLECGRNEHEQGGFGRHVVAGLLGADRPEGWEFIEKMLLAAQRQEGLRQVILESADVAHPEAFQRLLKLIVEHDLARFSAVTRALNVWFGYQWDSESTRVIHQTIEKAITFLGDESARKKAAAGTDPEAASLALWAMSIYEVSDSIAPAEKLLLSKQLELQYVAIRHLVHVNLPGLTCSALRRVTEREDLRIAYPATMELAEDPDPDSDAFERLERLIQRVPKNPETLPPLVWPWTEVKLDRERVAKALWETLGERPFSRVVPYIPMLEMWAQHRILNEFEKQDQWIPEKRQLAIQLAGSTSSDVRGAAVKALQTLTLTDEEIQQLEAYLSRKVSDLRAGAIQLIAQASDRAALASADRLLNSKSILQRVAGLELLRSIKDQDRCEEECLARAQEYRSGRKKITKEEQAQLDAIQAKTLSESGLSLKNGLGLFDPTKLTEPCPPKKRKVEFWTKTTEKVLIALDELIHSHMETPVTRENKTVLFGTLSTYAFPGLYKGRKAIRDLPLSEVWVEWVRDVLPKMRGVDGLELLRIRIRLSRESDWWIYRKNDWLYESPERKPIADLVNVPLPELRHLEFLDRLSGWLLLIQSPEGAVDYLTDCLETLCWMIPRKDLEATPRSRDDSTIRATRSNARRDEDEEEDWRKDSPVAQLLSFLEKECLLQNVEPEQMERVWRLLCWIDRPFHEAMRLHPDSRLLLQAFRAKQANLHDVGDRIFSVEDAERYFHPHELLAELTARRPDAFYLEVLQACPELRAFCDEAVARILDIELARGETPTIVTEAAEHIKSLAGVATLRRLLATMGKTEFKIPRRFEDHPHFAESLTRLVSVTYPSNDDTPEQFREIMKAAVKAGEFPEDRLIQLAFLAPQWVKFIQEYYGWTGFSEAVYWFLAHMTFLWGSKVGEKAAEGAGIVDAPVTTNSTPAQTPVAATDNEDADEETSGSEVPLVPVQKLTPWQRLVAERTPLPFQDREAGAVDVAWFHRVYEVLGAKNWQRVAQAARFASNPNQARKAQTIADVLLGKADLNKLIAGIEQKQLKDNVRLLGLYPLAKGTKRDADVKRRFQILQAYQQYARKLSGLTKPEAMRALEIGLKNLATTAGYADPLRLELALGAEELKDLAKGPVKAAKDGVSVTLELDEASQPVLSCFRGDKPLKTVPANIKKDPKVADLFERSKDLKRKAGRLRAEFEQCMVRGDTFTSQELVSLMTHPLVAPLLERLVLVGDGILGYPDRQGKVLRDFAGKLEPIKKGELLRIAHPNDFFVAKNWSDWQRECFESERVQPFKQIFRELYVLTKQEKADRAASSRYAGQQVNPHQAYALWGSRGWSTTEEGVFKTFHELGIIAVVDFNFGVTTPLEVEGLTVEQIRFCQRQPNGASELLLKDVPQRIFSEVMRDCDLVVSVAHRGGVDPEASASTVEMRTSLVTETAKLMGLKNVRIKANTALVDGTMSKYSVHLGSGNVHRLPGGSLCIVPVHAQHRGRIFLPFADDDPRTAEILSKVLLLARDQEIQDPLILEQLRV